MTLRRFLAAFALCVGASASSALASTDRTVDRWGVEEGLRNNALTSIIQTRDGYLWVGSWAGIVRFDGVRFTNVADDLPNVHARVLLEGRDGSVWVGTSGGGVMRWRPGNVQAFSITEGLAGSDVRALAQDADGRIWVGTEAGLSVIDGGRISTWRHEQGLADNVVTDLAPGRDGRMWVTTERGVCEAGGGQLRCADARLTASAQARLTASAKATAVKNPGTTEQSVTVSTVLERAAGEVLIGTRRTGLFERRADGTLAPACGGCLADHDIMVLLDAQDGGVWIGLGWGGGVALLRDGRVTHYPASEGLPPQPVVSLYEDPEGSLWIATDNGGLARLRPKRVTTYSMADGLPAKVVTSIVQDPSGAIWVATRCGPVSEFRNGRFEPRFAEFTKDACTHTVLPTRDGSLWIGTDGRGLFRWDGRRMHRFDRAEGLSDSTVAALLEDRDGVLWIGTDRGGLHRFVDGQLSRAYDGKDGVATGYIQSLTQDPDGRVWIGSNANGLTVYERGRFRTLGPEESPPAKNIAVLFIDGRGDLWIGTAANGLFRRRHGRYEHFSREQGLGDVLIALMIEDGDGNLWVSTARGISRLERARIDAVAEGRERSLQPIILDRTDGLVTLEGSGGGFDPSGLRARDGRLWFSTIDGIVILDPASFRINRIPPPLLIEGATLSGRRAQPQADGAIQVPAGTSSIELAYTAFSLLDPVKVRFRYRLAGFESEWQDVGNRRVAYYTRLQPATYTFEVMAANNDGVWSRAPASVRLVVAPFFWERREVQGAALALLLVATGFAVRAASLRRTRVLEAAVVVRTDELREERNKLQLAHAQLGRVHEDLLATFSRLRLGVMLADREGLVTFISPAAQELVGLLPQDAIGRPWSEVLALDVPDCERVDAMIAKPAADRAKVPARIRAADGETHWTEIDVADDPRDPERRIFVLYDVSAVYDLSALTDRRAPFHGLVGQSTPMQVLFKQIRDLAVSDATVLLEGETGTGKELVAHAIHASSRRAARPFVPVNCAGLTESLIASQLFGHRRGAFTGAVADQVGLFEAADGGTLFLDEIGDIPASVQTNLLRVVQEREITRVGESHPRRIDVRLVAATHRDLAQLVADGRFREDLLYRIRVARVHLPPLRDRRDDIPLIVAWLLDQMRSPGGSTVHDVSREAMQALLDYPWPGNVRELRSAVESAVIAARGPVIRLTDLPAEIRLLPPRLETIPTSSGERRQLLDALARSGGNRAAAARLLGIARSTLYRRLQIHGIETTDS